MTQYAVTLNLASSPCLHCIFLPIPSTFVFSEYENLSQASGSGLEVVKELLSEPLFSLEGTTQLLAGAGFLPGGVVLPHLPAQLSE